jgi:alpha-L-fucosidase
MTSAKIKELTVKKRNLHLIAGVSLLCVIQLGRTETPSAPYEAAWPSLFRHEAAPEWFRDAKLGIYFHWGVYSVPAFGDEWYPRNMHFKGSRENKHHIETYGEITRFGYHDFVKDFTAEHFDAKEWAALFKQAGARFAGPVAEHHDGFSMWASKITPWNAREMGPKRDITGELASALRAEGMKLITTFHHGRQLQRYADKPNETRFDHSHYPYLPGTATASTDPKLRMLYGNIPEAEWLETVWLGKLKEVIDTYQPDIIWFDSWLDQIPEKYRQTFCAYYLNAARQWNRDVVIVRKQEDLPIEFTVNDHEKSRESGTSPRVWMTDDTISTGSWCYTRNLRIKPASQVVHALIDTVSKNGVVLLNLSPKADGTIPDDQRNVLHELGRWLDQNGEAIYATRPWLTFGEGPTKEPSGGFGDAGKFLRLEYGPKDIRYTASKDGKTLYAVFMGWPQTAAVTLHSVRVLAASDTARVTLLGHSQPVDFSIDAQGKLVLAIPPLPEEQRPGRYAYAFKISGFTLAADPFSVQNLPTLSAEQAVLEGKQIKREEKGGRTNIGYWDTPAEGAHWLLAIPEPGEYQFRGEFAALDASRLKMQVNGKEAAFDVPSTGDWAAPAFVEMGTVAFEKPGVYHLRLYPAESGYRPVNLWQIQGVK